MTSSGDTRGTSVHSVDRAISILQVLARRGAVGVTQIAAEIDVHKSTVFRILSTLEARGLVEQHASRGQYQLGHGVVQLAAGATSRYDISLVSRPVCQELAEEIGETVNIAIHDGRQVINIDQVIGSSAVTTVNWVGQRTPLHSTSPGKVFLAAMSTENLDRVLDEGLERLTEHTIVDPKTLRKQLGEVRDRGFAYTIDEHEVGLASVAAPIREFSGDVCAAVLLSAPTFRMHEETIEAIAERVLAAAAAISERNGFPKSG